MSHDTFNRRSLHAFMTSWLGRSRAASRSQVDGSAIRGLQRLRQDPMWTSEHPLFGATPPSPVRKSFVTTGAAAAAVIVAMLAVTVVVRDGFGRRHHTAVVEAGDSSIYVVTGGAARRLQANDRVELGDIVRSNGIGGMLRLADGSRVEVRSQSELLLERADDGVRIRLDHGGLIVNAARQRDGHLYVQTKDVTVAVVGTVFLVNAGEAGSRVAVLEGEVRVQQGASDQTLLPGQQVTTSPSMTAPALPEEIAWSRNAPAHLALLEQSATAQGARSSPSLGREAVLAESASFAQTSTARGASQPLVLRADYVTIDVLVNDSARQPVLDLRASDFKVLENGVEQTVETSDLVKTDSLTYYLLGYRMPGGGPETFRRVEVRVDRPGVSVHSRAGYYPRPARFGFSRPPSQSDRVAAAQDDFSRGAHVEGEPGLVLPVAREERLPAYTAQGLLRRIQGDVVLEAVVDVDGRVARARVVSPLDKNQFGLDDEAVKAVSQWTFTAGELKGQKVPVLLRLVATFRIG
jgi:TonB family protein